MYAMLSLVEIFPVTFSTHRSIASLPCGVFVN